MQRRGVKKLHRISNHCSLKLFHNLCHGFFFFFFWRNRGGGFCQNRRVQGLKVKIDGVYNLK
jgi:hypothetical protein